MKRTTEARARSNDFGEDDARHSTTPPMMAPRERARTMSRASARSRAAVVAVVFAACALCGVADAARLSAADRAGDELTALGADAVPEGDGGFNDGFVSSLGMVLVSELGDETFIIAAIMAMRNSRGVVLAGGLCALTIMTVLSVMLGLVVPQLISKETVSKAAFVLYTFFGCRLMYLAYKSDGAASMTGEIEEVEEKLEKGTSVSTRTRVARVLAKISSPVFIEAFVLIFLAEWGDRSQITTIALATHKNPYGVAIGGILGHTFCTSLAVAGGRIVAMKISPRTVSFVGGILFFGFALHALYFGAPGTEHM